MIFADTRYEISVRIMFGKTLCSTGKIACCNLPYLYLLPTFQPIFDRLTILSVQGAHPNPAPTINIAADGGEPILLPYIALGTGSGQKGDVANAVSLWLGKTSGVAIDTAYDCKSNFSRCVPTIFSPIMRIFTFGFWHM